MKTDFYRCREHNQYDDLVVDVRRLYEAHPIERKTDAAPNRVRFAQSPFHRLYRGRLLPLTWRRHLLRLARRSHLDLGWFHEFRCYWTDVLGGRPLYGVEDFHLLRGLYRARFQDLQVPDTLDPHRHLEAWQRPEMIHQLLHQIYLETLQDQVSSLYYLFKLRRRVRRLLEFGCSTAPVTVSLFDFYQPGPDLTVYLADIQTVAFHFGAWRFRNCSNVVPLLIRAEDHFRLNLEAPVDAIFCLAVFEHLDRPLDTARAFHRLLAPGGLLIFDYVKGTGEALDTRAGVEERDAVLEFVAEGFDLLVGQLSREESTWFTVARRR